MESCIFCKILTGESPSHKIWENENFLAFLSIFPNTEGVTVVIPKKHYTSYIFDLSDDVMINLMKATKTVAKILDNYFEDVARTGLVFEGYGVNHVHSKLFPMHGTGHLKQWVECKSKVDKYFETYEGYISSHDHKRADDDALKNLAKKIINYIS